MFWIGISILCALVGIGIFAMLADRPDEVDASCYECLIHHSK